MSTWAVNPQAFGTCSQQLRELATKSQEASLQPPEARGAAISAIGALAADSPDTTGYLDTLTRVIEESTDENLAKKLTVIADQLVTEADNAVNLDMSFIGRLGC